MFVLTDYLKFLKMNFPASEEKEHVAVKREETQEKSVSKVLRMWCMVNVIKHTETLVCVNNWLDSF